MFIHNKRLQYTVRVAQPNPGLANLLLEQFGGAQGELAAAGRYFTQALAEDDPGRKDLLMDIATEELSHLEIVGSIIVMLNKGAKGRLAEGVEEEGALYRSINGAGNEGLKLKRMKCVAMEGLVEESKELLEEIEKGAVLDAGLIGASQKVEHYEIASYGTLIAMAKTLGLKTAAKLLAETLQEEKAADETLSAIAQQGGNQAATLEK